MLAFRDHLEKDGPFVIENNNNNRSGLQESRESGHETSAAMSISRKQPIISLSNSVLVLDYKRTRVDAESTAKTYTKKAISS